MNEPRPAFRSNVLAVVAYLFGAFSGLLLLLIERRDRYARFHAWQSLLGSVGVAIVGLIVGSVPGAGRPMLWLLSFVAFVVWCVLLFKAMTGQRYKLPYVGEFADRQIR